jgi:hypothetical protein
VAGYSDAGQGNDVFMMVVEGSGLLSSLQQTNPLSEPVQLSSEGAGNSGQSDSEQSEVLSVQLTSSHLATDVASSDDIGYAIAILPDGNVLAAGSSGNGDDLDFVVLNFASVAAASVADSVSSRAIRTAGFSFVTEPVTAVTRVGAMTGGRLRKLTNLSCNTCELQCKDDPLVVDCEGRCVTECLTVEKRGVTFSVTRNPVYREASTPSVTPAEGEEGDIFLYETVRSGQTEDGSGMADYGSDIVDITPETTYYARAYAVLSDETVIYGNQVSFKTKEACFIATAAYGSRLDKHVVILREFRDKVMKGNEFGRQLIGVYYHFSPPLADMIEQNEVLRAAARVILIPVVLLSFLILKTTLAIKISLLLAIFGIGIAAFKFSRKVQVTSI